MFNQLSINNSSIFINFSSSTSLISTYDMRIFSFLGLMLQILEKSEGFGIQLQSHNKWLWLLNVISTTIPQIKARE